MSEPQTPIPTPNLPASSSASAPHSNPLSAVTGLRDYRKGNWTVQETLTLITAKGLDDERRSKTAPNSTPTAGTATPRSAEQRWKWVENYCWRHDCLRSQNQCNDKWDNLLRDYKKVRDFESRPPAADDGGGPRPGYWSMGRHERKERTLPTNLSFEVFEALTDVLRRRNARRSSSSSSTAASPLSPRPPPPSLVALETSAVPPTLLLPPPPLLAPPSPSPPPPTCQAAPPPAAAQPSVSADVSESDKSDPDEPDTKRRKLKNLGSSVVRSASVLARTLMACEEKREQQHRELLELEERRLKLEEERTEMNRLAVSGLISAVNGMSNAIHALVSDHGDGDGISHRSPT